jgi:hypothetical protein
MSSTLEINGKKLQLIKDIVSVVSYSKDHITRLARERKITATNIGRQWYIDLDSLKNYEELSSVEQNLRKKRLSEERKVEQKTKISSKKKTSLRDKRAGTFKIRASIATFLVVGFGLFSGWATHSVLFIDGSSQNQLANTVNPFFTAVDVVTEVTVGNTPSSEIRSISESVEEGVLLFPHGASHASVTEMFSDEVIVLSDTDGTQTVVMVDEHGAPVGESIPFVIVPVNNRSDI